MKPINRVTKINDLVLDNFLQFDDAFEAHNYFGTQVVTTNGVLLRKIESKPMKMVRVYSNQNGWVSKFHIDILRELNPFDDITLTFEDGSTVVGKFDISTEYFKRTQIYYGALWYHITLNLLIKV